MLFAALPAFSQTGDEAVADSRVLTPAGAKLDALLKAGIARRLADLRVNAEQGDAEAQFNLGVMYDVGRGVPEDEAEAMHWYRLAATQDHAAAQNNLGVMYDAGRGVPQDAAEAARWYQRAAAQGIAEAQFRLGRMYARSDGVPEDDVLAHMWLNLAAAQSTGEEHERHVEGRDTVASRMTREDLSEAQRRAREWSPE